MTKKEISQEAVGKRIQALRKDVLGNISQEKFAKQIGELSRGAVGNWELGKGIKRENMQRIAEVFDVSFDWLATGRGEMRAKDRPEDPIEDEEEFRRLWAGADEAMRRAALVLLRDGQADPSKK